MTINFVKPTALVIGLTGGIGSGKTAVSNALGQLGATVIDTDVIAHNLTAQQGRAMPGIIEAFGSKAANPDGSMNRDYIRSLVFKSPSQRKRLEQILHPAIREAVQNTLNQGTPMYFLVVVPLLFEKGGWGELMDAIVVVDCPTETQIQRVMSRNGWPKSQIQAVIDNQATRETRLAGADFVIHNDGDLTRLEQSSRELHQKIIKMNKK